MDFYGPAQPYGKNSLFILNRYMLDPNNYFHCLAANQIASEFDPANNKDFEIKLLNRMKVSLGRSVNLLPNMHLLPRREPFYFKGVYPVRTALIMYGVDRLSKKDIGSFIFGD